jgi:molybdenum cofactor cytidylyltransferase
LKSPRVGLIVLAAGLARRFGSDKLLASLDGHTLAEISAKSAGNFSFEKKVAVVRPDAVAVQAPFVREGFAIIPNDKPDRGVGYSLKLGMRAVTKMDSVFIQLADLPRIGAKIHQQLWSVMASNELDAIRPCYDDQPGHPVLVNASCFDCLLACSDDIGAAHLFKDSTLRTMTVPVQEIGVIQDVDTPDDLARLLDPKHQR